MPEPTPKVKEAVERMLKAIDAELDPQKMTQQEQREFYDLLLDDVEVRYNQICEDLGEG